MYTESTDEKNGTSVVGDRVVDRTVSCPSTLVISIAGDT